MTEEVTSRKCGTTTRLSVKVFHYLSSRAQASIQSAALPQSSDFNSLLDILRPARVDRTIWQWSIFDNLRLRQRPGLSPIPNAESGSPEVPTLPMRHLGLLLGEACMGYTVSPTISGSTAGPAPEWTCPNRREEILIRCVNHLVLTWQSGQDCKFSQI